MQVAPFQQDALRVLQSGPWDPTTFGVVSVRVTNEGDRLEAHIGLVTDTPIQFEIDCYEWRGSMLYLSTRGSLKWVFKALD
jgi:hypothetical protein